MMTDNWKDITDPEELFRLKREGWEVQIQSDAGNDKYCPFKEWDGRNWNIGYLFRARPPQPKMKKVTSLCWRQKRGGSLLWEDQSETTPNLDYWDRFPAGDIEGEIPE